MDRHTCVPFFTKPKPLSCTTGSRHRLPPPATAPAGSPPPPSQAGMLPKKPLAAIPSSSPFQRRSPPLFLLLPPQPQYRPKPPPVTASPPPVSHAAENRRSSPTSVPPLLSSLEMPAACPSPDAARGLCLTHRCLLSVAVVRCLHLSSLDTVASCRRSHGHHLPLPERRPVSCSSLVLPTPVGTPTGMPAAPPPAGCHPPSAMAAGCRCSPELPPTRSPSLFLPPSHPLHRCTQPAVPPPISTARCHRHASSSMVAAASRNCPPSSPPRSCRSHHGRPPTRCFFSIAGLHHPSHQPPDPLPPSLLSSMDAASLLTPTLSHCWHARDATVPSSSLAFTHANSGWFQASLLAEIHYRA